MNLKLRMPRILLLALLIASFFQSCKDDGVVTNSEVSSYSNQVALAWQEMYLNLDQYAGGYRPGASARTAGLINYAVYEAMVPGMPKQKSLAHLYPQLSLPTRPSSESEMNWEIVANCTYKYMMERLFYKLASSEPDLFRGIQNLYDSEMAIIGRDVPSDVVARSKQWGEDVARAVYNWSKTDAYGHDAPRIDPAYVPPSGLGLWQPTYPDYTGAFFPHWGNVRTFAAVNSTLVSPPPIPYSEDPNSAYYKEGMEVYEAVNQIKAGNPAYKEQEWIAWFWSDDIQRLAFSPPARMIAIGNQMVRNERFNLEQAVVFYAHVGTAMNDIAVSVWKNKYKYNVERPVQFIRNVISKRIPAAANWTTILDNIPAGVKGVTPPFPAYPSGHSGFGGGMDVIFSAHFGVNGQYTMTDNCHAQRSEFPGAPRTFTSFKQMGEENAYSRIPLGVHFRMDCVEGLRIGRETSQNILNLPWK